ncbi:hypothetical protein [Prosthecochloris sp.]|uniref:hypothetical protein n=1 Tax=Prosthecochloris sp. TaxID=290513 RepID=UPI0025DFD6AC|nr:hypothetical protein [Prosthecochloris sp.]
MKAAIATLAAFIISNLSATATFAMTPSANGYGLLYYIIEYVKYFLYLIWC